MNFWQILIPTFVGSLLGFVFSIALFYLTRHWNRSMEKKSLERNLLREFEFNDSYLGRIRDDLTKAIEKVNGDDKQILHYFDYKMYQRFFFQAYFKRGFAYDKLQHNDVKSLMEVSDHMSDLGGRWINDQIELWKEDKINKQRMLTVLQFERDTIDKFAGELSGIRNKIMSR